MILGIEIYVITGSCIIVFTEKDSILYHVEVCFYQCALLVGIDEKGNRDLDAVEAWSWIDHSYGKEKSLRTCDGTLEATAYYSSWLAIGLISVE